MDVKPSDLAVGVVDLFAVFLPGAVLSFMGMRFADERIFGVLLPELRGPVQGWAAFIFCSFVLGHVVFAVASYLDGPYDSYRKAVLTRDNDKRYVAANKINPTTIGDTINAFKYAKAVLQLRCQPALNEIQRYEADSKFFRSLVVLFLVAAVLLASKGWQAWGACLASAAVSFHLYARQRHKSTERTYEYLIALEPPKAGDAAIEPGPALTAATGAGSPETDEKPI